jgi:hypothetical protein
MHWAKKYFAIAKKPNVSSFTAIVSESTKLVRAAIAKAVITCRNMQRKEITLFWYLWTEILILSVSKFIRINISRGVTVRSHFA